MSSPIQFTSTDFMSVMNDINSDPTLSDKPEFWKRIWAGVRDTVGVQINSTANQSFLRTAFTRQAVADLCALIDYQIAAYETASANLLFHLNADAVSFPVSFTSAELKAAVASGSKRFEARAGITERATSTTFTADAGTNLLTVAGETFTAVAATDLLNVAKLYNTGEKVQLTTATTLPAPLELATTYYAIYVSATTIRLAVSYAAAMAGTYINITDAGTGAHTIHRIYTTGEKVRFTTTGTLPDPLVAGTDYYVIYASATTIYIADSCAHAFANTYIDITTAGAVTNTIKMYTVTATCYQQETIGAPATIGTSDGATAWQIFYLPDTYALDATLSIVINSVTWTAVSTFVNSISTDTHYKILNLTGGMKGIVFGNGVNGAIPGNFAVTANYATGGGINSNVYTLNSITTYSGGSSYINTTTNPTTVTGGADEESIESAKVAAPMLLKSRGKDVTIDDTIYLAQAYPGVLRAGVVPNYFGPLSQRVMVIPNGGGVAKSELLIALAAYLTGLTIMDSVYTEGYSDISTYVSISPVATVHPLAGYVWATVLGYAVLGLRLMFCEITSEILNLYKSNGIIDAVTYINTKWATSFTSLDYTAISRMLDNVIPAAFGMSWQQSDVEGFMDSFVTGIDYIAVSSPAFPITLSTWEITTDLVSPSDITEV